MSHDDYRCDGITWRGIRCTRYAVKNFPDPANPGKILRSCGRSHGRPDASTKIERNGPCPCGSGQKYKRCCHFFAYAKPEAVRDAGNWRDRVAEREAELRSIQESEHATTNPVVVAEVEVSDADPGDEA